MAHHHHHHDTGGNLRAAFFLNLGFTLVEIVGGLWTNSLAILSDAVHDLGDSIALGMAWYLERYSKRGHDNRFSYGYRRFSLLGALINTIVLIVGAVVILTQAVPRLLQPEAANARGMVLLAILGVAVNGAAALRVRSGKSLNEQVVAWHLLEDVLGWTAVLVVSIVLLIVDLPILDPILAILITIFVLVKVVGKLRSTLSLFLQGVPAELDMAALQRQLLAIEGVRSAHHTHVWSLDGEHHVLTTHLVMEEEATRADALRAKNAVTELSGALGMEHTTVEIEYGEEDCSMNGNGCA